MSTIQEIESAVLRLPPDELRQFRQWFDQFDADAWDRQIAADAWDRQIAADAQAGKLDALAEKALRDYREGRCEEL
jgi:hypothetical protein